MRALASAEAVDPAQALLFDGGTFRCGAYQGCVARAVSFAEEDFDSLIAAFETKVPKDRPLVVYCDGIECRASEVLSRKFKEKGYKYIHCFFGGWVEWRDAKLEIEK